jgi:hypothetical protein
MPTVQVDVDVCDVLDEVSDDELREELRRRERRGKRSVGWGIEPDPWFALQTDLDFQMALNRGDAEEVMRRVQDAYCRSQRSAA